MALIVVVLLLIDVLAFGAYYSAHTVGSATQALLGMRKFLKYTNCRSGELWES